MPCHLVTIDLGGGFCACNMFLLVAKVSLRKSSHQFHCSHVGSMLNLSILPMHTSISGFQITMLMVQILINLNHRALMVMSSSIGASTVMMRVLIGIWKQLRICGGIEVPMSIHQELGKKVGYYER